MFVEVTGEKLVQDTFLSPILNRVNSLWLNPFRSFEYANENYFWVIDDTERGKK